MNSIKLGAIIVDLDGTLCNNDHRRHLIEGSPKDWPAFYAAMVDDTPNKWCVEIMSGWRTVLVSGRPDNYRQQTLSWLAKHGLASNSAGVIPLFMRKEGDFRQDAVVKEEIYRELIEPYYDVQFCIDDRKQVVDMWRSIGLTCLQCAEGDF